MPRFDVASLRARLFGLGFIAALAFVAGCLGGIAVVGISNCTGGR